MAPPDLKPFLLPFIMKHKDWSRVENKVEYKEKNTHMYTNTTKVILEWLPNLNHFHFSFTFVHCLCLLTYYIYLKESAFQKTMHYNLPALIPINPRHSEIETESNAGKEQSSSPDALLPKSDGKQ